MILNARVWGAGGHVAVLLHGMMGSAESWHRVGPALADRGYRVIALDLPGHGHSAADHELTVERAAAAVVDTVNSLVDVRPALAIGHSYGGMVLAAAHSRLDPERAVFVDAPTSSRGGWEFEEVRAEYARDAAGRRSAGSLRRLRPYYSDADAQAESEAARLFDPATAAALASSAGGSWPMPTGAVVIRPVGSDYVPDDTVAALRSAGVTVHSIDGAAHSVYHSHFDEFMAALPLG
jgi:pimeloyl-ACP methyl ester carboxylesterase